MSEPSPKGPANGEGRGADGKFRPGWRGGPGNPHAADVGRNRARFLRAIRSTDIGRAIATIRAIMEDGNAKPADRLAAARELLDRVIGKPAQAELLERIERLEQHFAEMRIK